MFRVRRLPHRRRGRADVPDLPRDRRRGGDAAGEGQPAPRARRSRRGDAGRGAGGRRPVRQLQDVPRRVRRPREHPEADARGEGRPPRRARPRPRRLGAGPRRGVRRARQQLRPDRQRPARPPTGAVAAGEALRRVAPPAAAGVRAAQLLPPRARRGLDAEEPERGMRSRFAATPTRIRSPRKSPTSWTCSPTTTTR